jgi:hypothetical protein
MKKDNIIALKKPETVSNLLTELRKGESDEKDVW